VLGGLNRALITQDAAGTYSQNSGIYTATYAADKSATYAWQAGVVFEIGLGNVSLQPALIFSQKGSRFRTTSQANSPLGLSSRETTGSTRANWLELPLNVVYTLRSAHGFQVFGGPYVALAVGGRQRGIDTTYTPIGIAGGYRITAFNNQLSYGPTTPNRRLDAGVNLGIGYHQGPLQVQLSYGLGLVNLYQNPESLAYSGKDTYDRSPGEQVAYNRTAQLTGTYFFSL
jgi:hypothetical protein